MYWCGILVWNRLYLATTLRTETECQNCPFWCYSAQRGHLLRGARQWRLKFVFLRGGAKMDEIGWNFHGETLPLGRQGDSLPRPSEQHILVIVRVVTLSLAKSHFYPLQKPNFYFLWHAPLSRCSTKMGQLWHSTSVLNIVPRFCMFHVNALQYSVWGAWGGNLWQGLRI